MAASAAIGFGVAPGGTDRPDRALALGATPMEIQPGATDEPTAAERFVSGRVTATPGVDPSVTPGPPEGPTAASSGVAAAALIQVSGESYSASTVKAWARQAGWPESTLDAVVAVAWCESRHRPAATNGIAYGLMQVVPLWFSYAGIPFAQWTDPVTNLRVAYAAYNYDLNRGYAPWTQWQCKPSMVATAPVGSDGVEDGVQPLPTPESTLSPETATPEPTVTPAPTDTPTASRTPSPVSTPVPTEAIVPSPSPHPTTTD